MESIINTYPAGRLASSLHETKNDIIGKLEREHNLVNELFSSFLVFKLGAV